MIYNALAQMPKFKKGEIAPVSVNSWFDAQTPTFAEVENDAGSIKAISRGSSEERATTPRYARQDQSTLEGSKQEALNATFLHRLRGAYLLSVYPVASLVPRLADRLMALMPPASNFGIWVSVSQWFKMIYVACFERFRLASEVRSSCHPRAVPT